MPLYKLMFRGDSRGPIDNKPNPFDNGLKAVDMNAPVTQLLSPNGIYQGFIGETTVCLTPDILSAVIFPMNRNPVTWIYCLYIDINEENSVNGFNRQVVSYLNLNSNQLPLHWFAREWAVKEVPNNQIVTAIKILRIFDPGKMFPQRFRIINCYENQHFTTPSEKIYRSLLLQYIHSLRIKNEISSNSFRHGFIVSETKGPGKMLTEDEFNERFKEERGIDVNDFLFRLYNPSCTT